MKELIALYGPWLLGLTTVVATLLVANKKAWTQLANIGNQLLWMVWIFAAESWGFLPLTAVMCFVFFRNYQKWRGAEKQGRAICPEHLGMGWVISNSAGDLHRTWEDGPCWTNDIRQALCFARREDAEMFARDDEDAWRIRMFYIRLSPGERDNRRLALTS
jgi:hypothetical protein